MVRRNTQQRRVAEQSCDARSRRGCDTVERHAEIGPNIVPKPNFGDAGAGWPSPKWNVRVARRAAPRSGEHNPDIFLGELGLTQQEFTFV